MWTLPQARRAIVVGGSLAMAYTQLTTSPATVQFARELGASSFHIGVLGALPVALIFMQVIAALAARRLTYRKPVWLAVSIVQRLVFLPAALGPWLLPSVPAEIWLWLLISLTFLNHALLHFGNPLWLSWMGDYLPHDGLSSFWGLRHTSQQWTAAATMFVNAMLVFNSGFDIRGAFAGIIVLGSALGVIDVLLFTRVEEPPARHHPSPRLWGVIASPFREPRFRSYIRFTCFWHMAAMIGAPFISLYLLEKVKMDLFRVLVLWMISWIGGAILSNQLGRWIDRFGQRPVLILCVAFKSSNMLALLLCPRDPTVAFWALAPVFALDAFLNAGIAIANNGFLIKNSPRENRTMFVAAGTAYAGLVGGLTSIVAGGVLALTEGVTLRLSGVVLSNYQALFLVSILLRLGAVLMAVRVLEPASTGTREVVLVFATATRQRVSRWWRAA
jgi:MFS family permease